jgi:hypothetical protein
MVMVVVHDDSRKLARSGGQRDESASSSHDYEGF